MSYHDKTLEPKPKYSFEEIKAMPSDAIKRLDPINAKYLRALDVGMLKQLSLAQLEAIPEARSSSVSIAMRHVKNQKKPEMKKVAFKTVAEGHYDLSDDKTVITKIKDSWKGAICDATDPMETGKHAIKLEVVSNGDEYKNGTDRADEWWFGVCRPESDVDHYHGFHNLNSDVFSIYQDNTGSWALTPFSPYKGNIVDGAIRRSLEAGDQVELQLDLDNGGTLTLYLDGEPQGTICEGLKGPLHWCIECLYPGKTIKVHTIPPLST